MSDVGTQEWWEKPGSDLRGPIDGILVLLMMESITRGKARELIEAHRHGGEIPDAPWDDIDWAA